MKALKIIKKIVLGIFGVAFFAFALGMTILLLNYNKYGVSQFSDTSFIILKDEITSEEFKKGDLVLVKETKLENIQAGEKIFAYSINEQKQATVDLGTVKTVYEEEKAIEYENGSTYSMEFVIGKSTKVYNKLGTYLSIIESKWGFLFLVLVPGFLIFIYQVYALIIEIKYGADEE